MAVNRLIGDYPVIGIRPTIDGRRGLSTVKVHSSVPEAGDFSYCISEGNSARQRYYVKQ